LTVAQTMQYPLQSHHCHRSQLNHRPYDKLPTMPALKLA
jgi:hypothetical protein